MKCDDDCLSNLSATTTLSIRSQSINTMKQTTFTISDEDGAFLSLGLAATLEQRVRLE